MNEEQEIRKQKILIVHNYYQIPGGEDTVVANEKKMMEDHGHEVILYSRNNLELKKMVKAQKLLLPFSTIFNFRTYREIKKIIRENRIDIVHVHNTLNLISPSVYYAARHCNIPVVQTIHNFRMLCPGATFYRDGHICEECMEKGLHSAIKYRCYRNSRLQTIACVISTKIHRMTGIYSQINFICLTEFNKEKMQKLHYIKKNRLFVKANFVGSIGDAVPADKRENRIIFAGRLDKQKGIDFLLQAWKQLKSASPPELMICGTGPLEEWAKQFISDNGLDTVKLMGFVSNTEVRKLVGYSKGLILPTQCYEGFPMSIVEAFSVGTPVICSDLGNAGSVVTEGITGCKFKVGSAEKIVDAVERLTKYNNIYNTTMEEYINKYTQNKNYKELMRIYEEVTAEDSKCALDY